MQQAGTKVGTQGVRARSRLVYGWPNLSFLELCGGREALPSLQGCLVAKMLPANVAA